LHNPSTGCRKLQPSGSAEREGQIHVRFVTRRQPPGRDEALFSAEPQTDLSGIDSIMANPAAAYLSYQHSGELLHNAATSQRREHTVNAIRRLTDVFDE